MLTPRELRCIIASLRLFTLAIGILNTAPADVLTTSELIGAELFCDIIIPETLAANEVLSLAINTNLYLNDNQPWLLIKDKDNLALVKQIIYNVLESTRIIGLLLIPLLPELSTKINEQLGSIYKEEIPWEQQLSWGILVSNSILPKPNPIINKLEYE